MFRSLTSRFALSLFLLSHAALVEAEPRPAHDLLRTLPVTGQKADAFRVYCDRGTDGNYALSVTTVKGGKPVGSVVVEDGSDCAARFDENEGFDDNFMLTMRPFALAPGRTGLFLQSENSGEAVYRTYWLVGDAPKLLWRAHFSSQEIVPLDDHAVIVRPRADGRGEELEWTEPFSASNQCIDFPKDRDLLVEEEVTDTWHHERVTFDEVTGAAVALPAHEWSVTLGSFPDANAAMRVKCRLARKRACKMDRFLVLDRKETTALDFDGDVLLSAIVGSKAAADALAKPDARCKERPRARVDRFFDGPRAPTYVP